MCRRRDWEYRHQHYWLNYSDNKTNSNSNIRVAGFRTFRLWSNYIRSPCTTGILAFGREVMRKGDVLGWEKMEKKKDDGRGWLVSNEIYGKIGHNLVQKLEKMRKTTTTTTKIEWRADKFLEKLKLIWNWTITWKAAFVFLFFLKKESIFDTMNMCQKNQLKCK